MLLLILQKKTIMSLEIKNKAILFPNIGKLSIAIFGLLLIFSGMRAFELFGYVFKPNISQDTVIYIKSGSDFEDILNYLEENKIINNVKAFKWVAKKKKYNENIKPGRYEFKKGTNTNEIINKLRIGNQDPLNLTFSNVRIFSDLAGKVSKYIEADSISLLANFNNPEIIKKYNFTPESFSSMFIPNTYQFFWTTNAEQFIERMYSEYKKFWNDERINKSKALGLTPLEATVLASIVQDETAKEEEKPAIAGLYQNRLKRGMLLQADPTIKYAMKNFELRRITNDMLKFDSPYNTYLYAGLPPGPINFPETSSIDAVLNPAKHNFIYMCAKEDFSGFHNFATNLSDHNRNAAKYQQELNKNKIWK